LKTKGNISTLTLKEKFLEFTHLHKEQMCVSDFR
jgi:hypothetical protein